MEFSHRFCHGKGTRPQSRIVVGVFPTRCWSGMLLAWTGPWASRTRVSTETRMIAGNSWTFGGQRSMRHNQSQNVRS